MIGGTFASLLLHASIAGLIVGVLPQLAPSKRELLTPQEVRLDVVFRAEIPAPSATPLIDFRTPHAGDAPPSAAHESWRSDVNVVAEGHSPDGGQSAAQSDGSEARVDTADTATRSAVAPGGGKTSTDTSSSVARTQDVARAEAAAKQARAAAQAAKSSLDAAQRAGRGVNGERAMTPDVRLSFDAATAHVLSAEAAAESAEDQARRAAGPQQSPAASAADLEKSAAGAAEVAKERAFAEAQAAADILAKMPLLQKNVSSPTDASGRPLSPSVNTILKAVAELDKRFPQPSSTSAPVSYSPPQAAALIERYQNAAAAGFAHAQYNLARALVSGHGIPPDPEKAIQLLRQLAERGYGPAAMRLAEEDLRGEAASANKAEAFAWYAIAARDGSKAAARAQSLLGPLLVPAEREVAEHLTQQLETRLVNGRRGAALPEQQAQLDKALILAVDGADVGSVDQLMRQGADPSALDKYGRSAVISAAWRGRTSIVSLLISRGVDVDANDNQGRTALGWAAINGYSNMAAELIAAGGATDIPDLEGLTPLMRAAWNNHVDVVRSLLHAGAAIELRDGSGKTALDRALSQGNEEIVQQIRQAVGTR
jgi:TPR repeat protein